MLLGRTFLFILLRSAGEVGLTTEPGAALDTFGRLLSAAENGSHLHHLSVNLNGSNEGTCRPSVRIVS